MLTFSGVVAEYPGRNKFITKANCNVYMFDKLLNNWLFEEKYSKATNKLNPTPNFAL